MPGFTIERESSGAAAQAWDLIARPGRWHEWAPHIRGAWGLGSPEVQAGQTGFVRLFGAVPVPARILDKQPAHSWTWQVGAVRMTHRVEPRDNGGCTVAIDVRAPGALAAALEKAYGPVIGWALGRLAARA